MSTITKTAFQADPAAALAAAEDGPVIITSHGRPVAQLVAAPPGKPSATANAASGRTSALQASGILKGPKPLAAVQREQAVVEGFLAGRKGAR